MIRVAWSPDGAWLASASHDRSVSLHALGGGGGGDGGGEGAGEWRLVQHGHVSFGGCVEAAAWLDATHLAVSVRGTCMLQVRV